MDDAVKLELQRTVGTAATPRAFVVPSSGVSDRLSDADVQVLSAVCPPRTYRRGDRVYHAGDPAGTLCVLLHGFVKLSAPARLGGERVLAVCGPDDFFGESFLAGDLTRGADAVSLEDGTVVCAVSRDAFVEVARRAPTAALAFTAAFAARAHVLQGRLDHLARGAQARLALTLLTLARRFGRPREDGWVRLELELRHEDLAGLANVSRVTATELLSRWRTLGLVVGTRGRYDVHLDGLENLCEDLEQEGH